jgi:hypothetical protein
MDQQRPAKGILNAKGEGREKGGRPKLRWEDGVDNDVKGLGERILKNTTGKTQAWANLLR